MTAAGDTTAIANRAAAPLAVRELSKDFGTAFRLGPATFSVARGETVGILGQNGAGKTTLFQLLTGNLDAAGGEIRVGGERLTPDTPELKRRLGYLPQNPYLPRWATGGELLRYAASLYGLRDAATRVPAAEAYWDCASFRGKPLATLSYGTQKRVGLALATLHDPEVLILDEPFSGLDLVHIKALERAIGARAAAGRATLLSTHVISFCAKLCHRTAVIERGAMRFLAGWEAMDAAAREAAVDAAFFPAGETPGDKR